MHLTSKHYITTFIRAENEHRQILSNLILRIKSHFLLVHCPDSNCQNNQRQVAVTQPDRDAVPESREQQQHSHPIDLHIFNCIEKIFLNGLRAQKPDHTPDIWRFIAGLSWLNPQMTTSIANQLQQASIANQYHHHHIPLRRIRNNRALAWIYECLETRTLSKKLQYLLSDHEHLANCYEITAYMHSERYVVALFCCLNAIEHEKPNLLSEIDKSLYEIRSDIRTGAKCDSHISSTSGDLVDELRNDTERQWTLSRTSDASCSAAVAENTPRGTMGNSRSLLFNYDDTPHSSRWGSSSGVLDEQQQARRHEVPEKRTPREGAAPSSSARKHKRRYSSRMRFKHMISQRLRPWISLPDVAVACKPTLIRCRSQPTFRASKSRINKLTAANLAFNDRCLTPMSTWITPRRTHFDRLNVEIGDNIDLTPINLVKCDNIKIHLDRKLTPMQREDHNTLGVQPPDETTPGTSPNAGKSGGKFSSFWRNIPGKRNIFFSSMRTAESSGSAEKHQANSATGDFVNTFLPQDGEKIEKRYNHTALQDVVNDTETPLLISQLPVTAQTAKIQPTRGQSLTSYLQALQTHRTNATELERENAHFDLSDVIIAAIEQAKCLHSERLKDKQIRAIRRLKKRANGRPRRLRNWFNESDNNEPRNSEKNELFNSDLSLSSTTSASSELASDSDVSHASNNSTPSVNSADRDADAGGDLKYLQIFSVSSHSINDHAAYAEWAESSFETYSAEGIALSLISKFKDRQLPSASDVLADASISEDPMSLHANSDPYGMRQLICTRGTAYWAPPRPQIIFTRHHTPDRKRQMQLQNNKCAGCGMLVAPQLSHYFRFCEYLGKYHCTGCHRNQISAIPARVLDRWDFSCHPVSVFAYRLLEQIWKVPLFHVPDLNNELYAKVRALRMARLRRVQLKYITDYIRLCRFADDARRIIDNCPPYYVDDVDLWSLNDFVAVRNGTFFKELQQFIGVGEQHVYDCELCTNRAFLCEYCDVKQVIFPWQSKVIRCEDCGTCAHHSCWKANTNCSKCQRLQQRKKSNSG